MPSANGYGLDVTVNNTPFVVTASWAAPYFVLLTGIWGVNDAPYADLHHCDDLAHAQSVKRNAQERAVILNADFTPYAE